MPRQILTALLALLLMPCLATAQAEDTSPAPEQPELSEHATRLLTTLEGISEHLDALERFAESAQQSGLEKPPQILLSEAYLVEGQLAFLSHRTRGLHFSEIQDKIRPRLAPEIDRARSLNRRLERWEPQTDTERPSNRPIAEVAGVNVASGSGAISGTVRDASDGTPIAGVEIEVYCLWIGSWIVETAADGTYEVAGLDDGTYYVAAEAEFPHISETFDNHHCYASCQVLDADPLTIAEGELLTGIDFDLEQRGTLSGVVTRSDTGEPADGGEVTLVSLDGSGDTLAFDLNPDGTYSITPDRTRSWAVVASHPDLIDELHDGIPCRGYCLYSPGQAVFIPPSSEITVNFELDPIGVLTGNLTDADDGTPLDATVYAVYPYTDLAASWESATGAYSIASLAPGQYHVYADQAIGHLPVIYSDIPCELTCDPYAGTLVSIISGEVTGGIDFAVPKAPTVSGAVRDLHTGEPIGGVNVNVYDKNGNSAGSDSTDWDGQYTATAIPPTAFAAAWSFHHTGQIFDHISGDQTEPTSGTPIIVETDDHVEGVDFDLEKHGGISGRVTIEANGEPFPNASVRFFDEDGEYFESTTTSHDGTYGLSQRFPPGIYFAKANQYWTGYGDIGGAGELFSGIDCNHSCDVTSGTAITVESGVITSGVDFSLGPLGSISGKVTDGTTASGVSGVKVYAYWFSRDEHGWLFLEQIGQTEGDGTYHIENLNESVYCVVADGRTQGFEAIQYPDLSWNKGFEPDAGDPVLVTAGTTTTGIDFTLMPATTIRGELIDSNDGSPVLNGRVELFLPDGTSQEYQNLSSSSEFAFENINPGSYRFEVSATGYVREMYAGHDCPYTCDEHPWCDYVCDPTMGDLVAVSSGDELELDIPVRRKGTFSGSVVRATDGQPLGSASIAIHDHDGSYLGYQLGAPTDPSGEFQTRELNPGTYYAIAWEPDHQQQIFGGVNCSGHACEATLGTPVVVQAGQDTAGVDFQLVNGGLISGTVRSANNGEPLLAYVELYDGDGEYVSLGYAPSESGYYGFSGLSPGQYYLHTSNTDNHVDVAWGGYRCEPSCDPTNGIPVSITGTEHVQGVDFALRPFGKVLGYVSYEATDQPLRSVRVEAFDSGGHWQRNVNSASNGWFDLQFENPGVYYLRSNAANVPLIDQLHAGIECEPDCDPTLGTPIVVDDGAVAFVDFALSAAVFKDAPPAYWSRQFIERLAAAGVTSGCNESPPLYCPQAVVERQQMAVFLMKASEGSGWVPPPAVGVFDDVDPGSPFAPWIEALVAEEVTAGCSAAPPLYCPADPVTRQQMAIFLLKTIEGGDYVPPPATGMFEDVDPADPVAPWVEELARREITSGCSTSPPRFCPTNVVQRDQMAVFLVKAFALP